jgi:hypothetical protein
MQHIRVSASAAAAALTCRDLALAAVGPAKTRRHVSAGAAAGSNECVCVGYNKQAMYLLLQEAAPAGLHSCHAP